VSIISKKARPDYHSGSNSSLFGRELPHPATIFCQPKRPIHWPVRRSPLNESGSRIQFKKLLISWASIASGVSCASRQAARAALGIAATFE
jgi:hypothetical protein